MGMETPATGSTGLLDRYLPNWQFREIHSRRIAAPSARVVEAVLTITPRDTPLSGSLMALRLAPAALAARKWPLPPVRPWIDLLLEFGFVELGRTDQELAFGAVGQFWRVRERLEPIADADAFEVFDQPGFAKGAINFRVSPEEGSVTLVTETRVMTTDDQARRSFAPYWLPVRAIGGLMRREMLAATARVAAKPPATQL
jgi:hypothetical protein